MYYQINLGIGQTNTNEEKKISFVLHCKATNFFYIAEYYVTVIKH